MKRLAAAVLLALLLPAALLQGQMVTSAFDASVDKATLRIRQVAIIPNRLPLVLQEPEMWRRDNWQLLADELARMGYAVVPYETTVQMALKANLPLEDTLSSTDKYAEFCRLTGTDMLVMPYYATSFRSSPFFLATRNQYSSTVSYQFYSLRDNVFFHRADATGTVGYTSGLGVLLGLGVMLLSATSTDIEAAQRYYQIGGLVMGASGLVDLFRAFTPATTWWKRGFRKAVPEALQPFRSYAQGLGTAPAASAQTLPAPAGAARPATGQPAAPPAAAPSTQPKEALPGLAQAPQAATAATPPAAPPLAAAPVAPPAPAVASPPPAPPIHITTVARVARNTIRVDGRIDDWVGIEPILSDASGDSRGPAFTDLKAVYMAIDDRSGFVRFDLADRPRYSDRVNYGLRVKASASFDFTFGVDYDRNQNEWQARISNEDIYRRASSWKEIARGTCRWSGSTLEMQVSLGAFEKDIRAGEAYRCEAWANIQTASNSWIGDYVSLAIVQF